MNYADERWLKVYTRDTGGWTMLSWQAKRGTRLPDGWTPSDETQAWARAIGHYPLRAVLPDLSGGGYAREARSVVVWLRHRSLDPRAP